MFWILALNLTGAYIKVPLDIASGNSLFRLTGDNITLRGGTLEDTYPDGETEVTDFGAYNQREKLGGMNEDFCTTLRGPADIARTYAGAKLTLVMSCARPVPAPITAAWPMGRAFTSLPTPGMRAVSRSAKNRWRSALDLGSAISALKCARSMARPSSNGLSRPARTARSASAGGSRGRCLSSTTSSTL